MRRVIGGEATVSVQRLPHEAELNLSNAIACLSEAAVVIRQHLPSEGGDNDDDMLAYTWHKQLSKIKMAIGLAGNVRDTVTNDRRFAVLQPKK